MAMTTVQAKAKMLVIRDVEREDIEFISKTLGCLPIAAPEHMHPDKLAHADLVEEEEVRHLLLLLASLVWLPSPISVCRPLLQSLQPST